MTQIAQIFKTKSEKSVMVSESLNTGVFKRILLNLSP